MAPNRGVIAAALLLGIALAVALPGAGLGAAGAGNEAERRALAPPDTSPAQTGGFFHVEWSAASPPGVTPGSARSATTSNRVQLCCKHTNSGARGPANSASTSLGGHLLTDTSQQYIRQKNGEKAHE